MENVYKCSICGKEFNNVVARANCELKCSKKLEEDAKKAVEEKKKAEREARYVEVEKAINVAYDLMNKYIKDYGSYSRTERVHSPIDDLFHYMLF